MPVRAKFKYVGYEASLTTRRKDRNQPSTDENTETVEMRSLKFQPVYANDDPNHENSRFWAYTPSGEIRLGTINPEAWKEFEIGEEYYVDFTPAK
jgi:hypothetical protein